MFSISKTKHRSIDGIAENEMDSNQQEFNNKAFIPYAINGNETTYVPKGKYYTLTDCKDDGYVKPFMNGEHKNYHQYENPAEVAKRAGLSRAGSGPRRQKNALYGEAKGQRVRLQNRATTQSDGAECSPLVVNTTIPDYDKERSSRKCDLKTIIFFVLVLCLSAGGLALSLMNMLNESNCQCSQKGKKSLIYNDARVLRILSFIYFIMFI